MQEITGQHEQHNQNEKQPQDRQHEQPALMRGLTPWHAGSLVVGGVIGTGVFLKSGIMAHTLGSSFWILMAWLAAGVLSLIGGLVYAEIGAMFPQAGGEYLYVRAGYGNLLAFLYGWMRFWIGSPGSAAAYAVGASTFLAATQIPWFEQNRSLVAIALILVFVGLNCLQVSFGGKLQSFLTILKIGIICVLSVAIFSLVENGSLLHLAPNATNSSAMGWPGWGAFGTAVLAALWAFDGWNNMPMVAGEIQNPQRSVPLALILGVGGVLFLYLGINAAYIFALPFPEIASAFSKFNTQAHPVATKASASFLGASGQIVLSCAFCISAVGALNGSILTCSRIPYAMAKDGWMPKFLSVINPKTHVPIYAILAQGAVALALAISGTFDQLTDYVVFASWIFYCLVAISLILFRKKQPKLHRPFRVPGYPYLPIIFAAAALFLLVNTLISTPRESFFGLFLILTGVPFYYYIAKKRTV